ncbi:MAG: nucleoside deaminase [Pseudomonadota bacterium]
MSNEHIIRAIELAKQSVNQGGGPFAAVIVKDNQIIGEGVNQVTQQNDPTAHAEIQAIRNACKKLSSFQLTDCTLYTTSEPCPMCLSAIYWSRLEQVYYANSYQQAKLAGFDDQFIFNQLNLPHQQKKIHISQIQETEILNKAADIFRLWDNKEDKIKY